IAFGFVEMNYIMNLRSGAASGFEAETDFDALDCLYSHHRLRDAAVELEVPLRMSAEAKRHALDANLDDAAQRIAGFARLVDELLQLSLARWIERVDFTGIPNLQA